MASAGRIVLVHRDAARAEALAEPLRAAGLEVLVLTSLEAGQRAAQGKADAVILDVDLDSPASEAVRPFRLDERARLVPLLALVDRPAGEEEVGAILSAGAMDVLVRPFSPPLLRARVGNLVRIHQEEEQLRDTERRYRRIFATSHYGYFMSSPEGRFLEVNDALLNILGYSTREEMLGLRLPEDLYVQPSERKVIQALLEKQGFIKDYRVEFKRKDGTTVTILLTANVFRSADGQTVGYEGFNIPLLDLEPPRPAWMPRWLGRLLVRLRLPRGQGVSVSRISELVANQYVKTEELSEGYYCSVWKGRDVLGFEPGPLVIKISKADAINGRLLAEARALRRLAGHPAIPQLVDVARHRGRTVIVTRYVDGKPLSEVLHLLTPVERDRIAYQLLDVVAHLHDFDVVHRDIKPSNIILRPDGRIVLLDYGIVRQLGAMETSSTIIGTRPYMSPEQVNGRSERRSDVWAVGVVLYQMYTGRLPFDGDTEIEAMENILHREPVVPRALNPELPAPLEAALLRALRKRPESRYHSAREMRDDIFKNVASFRANVEDLVRELEKDEPLVP